MNSPTPIVKSESEPQVSDADTVPADAKCAEHMHNIVRIERNQLRERIAAVLALRFAEVPPGDFAAEETNVEAASRTGYNFALKQVRAALGASPAPP